MDATFWATVALFIFLGLLVFAGVPGSVGRALDARSQRIRADLDEARRLREEAQQLLAEFKRKRKEAEREAEEIVEAANREAGAIVSDAKAKTEEYVTRRTALAEQKIAQAERDAVAQVRGHAVDIAVAAAGKLLADKLDAKSGSALFESALDDVKARLN